MPRQGGAPMGNPSSPRWGALRDRWRRGCRGTRGTRLCMRHTRPGSGRDSRTSRREQPLGSRCSGRTRAHSLLPKIDTKGRPTHFVSHAGKFRSLVSERRRRLPRTMRQRTSEFSRPSTTAATTRPGATSMVTAAAIREMAWTERRKSATSAHPMQRQATPSAVKFSRYDNVRTSALP